MDFGERFKQIRRENHFTQEEVATELSVSRQAVSHWENNNNFPDVEILIHIALLFNISLDELILGKKSMMGRAV